MPDFRDPAHVQAYKDTDAAMSMARAAWKETGLTPGHEVLGATVNALLEHIRIVRRMQQQPTT
jgi:hypothetical protein